MPKATPSARNCRNVSDRKLSLATHWKLAQEAFAHTAAYDMAIAARLAQVDAEGNTIREELPQRFQISVPRTWMLRYGENPHQKAALYSFHEGGIAGAEIGRASCRERG